VFRLKDSPLVSRGTTEKTRRNGAREDVVGAPAPEIVVPRAIPDATNSSQDFRG
jgi:hypothetical protein